MKNIFLKRKIRTYTKRVEKNPNDPVLCVELAEFYLELSQPERAADYYQRAIETYYQEDSRLGEDKDFILEVCWKLLEIDPLHALAHRMLGQEYCQLGEFDEAIDLYAAYAARLTEAALYEEAIAQYRNVLVLNPGDIAIHQKCFSLLWKLHRKEDAVQELRKIAELAEKAGHLAKVIECYKKALKIMPSHGELQAELHRVAKLIHTRKHPLRLVVNK
jgi:tetratricopeptide (TPR) repeat protein